MSASKMHPTWIHTKIVCTIGPSTSTPEALRELIEGGMAAARLNFAHGSHEQHSQSVKYIRQISKDLGKLVAIIQDLPGPKVRIGKLAQGEMRLEPGEEVILTTQPVTEEPHRIPVNLPTLHHDLKPGNTIFLADGAIQLEARNITETGVRCQVIGGGILHSDQGINIPETPLSIPSVTEQDFQHLLFGLEQGVDFIALSFVRDPDDVVKVKDFIKDHYSDVPVIAKVEKREALEKIGSVLEVADGVMVARGDLGLEIPLERVPLAQKEVIERCNQLGKPVIVATQMLESMVDSVRPTRAEVTDVANAIFDGADALMLSGETAIGSYPIMCLKTMLQIAATTEAALPYEDILMRRGKELKPHTDDAISYDVCHTSYQLNASAIIAFTSSGSTAQRISRYRPPVPVLAITYSERIQRRLSLSWGVYPHLVEEPATLDELFLLGTKQALETSAARKNDLVVMSAGLPIGVSGSTNMLRVEKV